MKWPVVLQRSSPLIFRVLGCLLFHFVTGFQKLGEPFSDGYSVFYLDGIFSSLSTSDNVQLLVNLEGPTFSCTEAWEWMQPPRPCRASGEAAPRWPVLLCSRRWTHVLWRPLPDRLPGLLRVLSSGGLDLWGYSWLLEKKKKKNNTRYSSQVSIVGSIRRNCEVPIFTRFTLARIECLGLTQGLGRGVGHCRLYV